MKNFIIAVAAIMMLVVFAAPTQAEIKYKGEEAVNSATSPAYYKPEVMDKIKVLEKKVNTIEARQIQSEKRLGKLETWAGKVHDWSVNFLKDEFTPTKEVAINAQAKANQTARDLRTSEDRIADSIDNLRKYIEKAVWIAIIIAVILVLLSGGWQAIRNAANRLKARRSKRKGAGA